MTAIAAALSQTCAGIGLSLATPMKGAFLNFMELVAENPELARKLGELASEFDFEFTDDGLTDSDLEAVAGGAQATLDDMVQMDMLKMQDSMNQQSLHMRMMSNIRKH